MSFWITKCASWNEHQAGFCVAPSLSKDNICLPLQTNLAGFVPIIHCCASCSCWTKTGTLGEDQGSKQSHHDCWFILFPARFPCVFLPPAPVPTHHWQKKQSKSQVNKIYIAQREQQQPACTNILKHTDAKPLLCEPPWCVTFYAIDGRSLYGPVGSSLR